MKGTYSRFARSAALYPERPALWVDGTIYTYAELADSAERVAATLADAAAGQPLVGVLAHRSHAAYAGVLGTLAAGRGYVPLNPKFPLDRLMSVINESGIRTIIVGAEAVDQLLALLEVVERPLNVVTAALDLVVPGPHRLFAPDGHGRAAPVAVAEDEIAYLLFTSGSTGRPKGVPITHRNLWAYVDRVLERSGLRETDRVSQMSDLTFDWSVHDLYPCWTAGACLYCVPERNVFAPAKFIREHALTVWASVPSVVVLLERMRLLKPSVFGSIRYSAFCGEPLLEKHAAAWRDAVANSIVDNYYGPTEATVAVTAHRVGSDPYEPASNGVAAIGVPFPGVSVRLVDSDGTEVPDGEAGELCIGGVQVAQGYWHDAALTAQKFVHLGEESGHWYRTGDLARRDAFGCLHFAGRIDFQVKVRGYRVELAEIENILRVAVTAEQVVTVGWPFGATNAEALVAFVAGAPANDEKAALQACRRALPDYMVPRRLVFLDRLPLTNNGKVDRNGLVHLMKENAHGQQQ